MSAEYYTADELGLFKQAQKLAYQAAQYTEKKLYEGITEVEAAAIMEGWLKEQGVRHFFHHSFAWFGDRAGFHHFEPPPAALSAFPLQMGFATLQAQLNLPHFGRQFQPSERRLEKGMAVILDVAPVIENCPADIGYVCTFGENARVENAMADLAVFRPMIKDGVNAGKTLSAIYHEVDLKIKELGYENAHANYPGAVLAHKVGKIAGTALPGLNIHGFDLQSLLYLGGQLFGGLLAGQNSTSPLWGPNSDFKAEPGLYAVEPHIRVDGIGAKWEEILVVDRDGAWWLDDDLPHVNGWKKQTATAGV